jgi:hypothetical protein
VTPGEGATAYRAFQRHKEAVFGERVAQEKRRVRKPVEIQIGGY